ncbi:MAG: threonine/serine dehydratase [Aureliella sp.]
MSEEFAITGDDVFSARERIATKTIVTPCVYSEALSKRLGFDLYFKAENLQHIGAFKARGALNAVLQLTEDEASRGVVTHSSGNHAAALARAARVRGIVAHVVMPENSAQTKIEAVRGLGVEPVFCKPGSDSREQTAAEIQQSTGAVLIHPFEDPRVMAGQGTVGLEIVEQVPDVDTVIAPVGGGGLMSGVLTAMHTVKPKADVYCAEPEWADDTYRSFRSGKIEDVQRIDTVADGLRTRVGESTWPIIRHHAKDVLVASESEILTAMRTIIERVKLVAEPSGAVAFACLCRNAEKFQGQRVVVVITGGNVDMSTCRAGQP